MSLTQQSERAYKGRDCKNGHGISCLILGNQKGYRRQDCASESPIRHFVPHSQQSKGSRKVGLRIWATNSALHASTWQSKSEWMDCDTSLANRWIANSALRASSGNQEMAIKKENIWADQYNANYTSDPLTNWPPNQTLESYLKVTGKWRESAWNWRGTEHVIMTQ